MARFKDKDIIVLTNEELLLGNAQDAYIKYDGSDLITGHVLRHDTQGYFATRDYVDQVLSGLEWQDSVLSKVTDIPAGVYGERYIIPTGATGAWSGLDDTIAEYTTTWVYTTPSAGFATFVEDEGAYFVYNGSIWARMGSVIDHSLLDNLDVDDHTQYLHTDGSRAIDTLTVTTSAFIGGQLKMDTGIVPTDGQLLISPNDSGCLSFFAYNADNNAIGFDVRRTGGTWIAEDTSCAVIYKLSDFLQIMTRTGETPDTPVTLLRRAVFDLSKPVLYIGDETENTKMSAGLTIHQGGSADEILAFKSTNVVHGATNLTETDTYGWFEKYSSTRGGLKLSGIAENNAAIPTGLLISSYVGVPNTVKTTAAYGMMTLFTTTYSGASVTNVSNDANLFIIRTRKSNTNVAMWLCDMHGDTYQDGDIMPFNPSTQDIGSSSYPWANVYSDVVSAGSLYGDGTGITGSDHGDLTGLDDDDHPIYLPSDGSRAMTGTLTINTTGGYMRFSGLTADIGLASDIDMINLSSVGVTIDNNLTVTGSLSADHDTLLGLLDDDHSIYLNTTRHDTTDRHGAASVDHGLIDGLGDDDHSQYSLADGTRIFTGSITVSADQIILVDTQTPGTSGAAGEQGTIAWDTNYIYICIQDNIWKRAELLSW
jgi:hypothetical protein